MTADAALDAARRFAIEGEPTEATRLGAGHIHQTWQVRTTTGPDTVLQRLNERVFPRLDEVMENVSRVTAHLRDKRGAHPDAERRGLTVLRTRDGETLYRDADRHAWRAFPLIPDTRTFQTVPDASIATEAAAAFGRFAVDCVDLDARALRIPIPGFHDFDARRAAFERAVAEDPQGRAGDAADTLALARAHVDRMQGALREHDLDALPLRVVHNDCKLNNVLFDAEHPTALCVIDLDTVMPGWLLHDFGDLGRTASCASPEDTRELDRVSADPALLDAVTRGYVAATRSVATPAELALLPLASPWITLETGLRFLTDHLLGDTYFAIERPGQNLDRGRMQLRLFESLFDARSVVADAIADV